VSDEDPRTPAPGSEPWRDDVRERFAAAVRAEQVDLGLACLLLAADAGRVHPDLAVGSVQDTVDAGMRTLDELAELTREVGAAEGGGSAATWAHALAVALGKRAGFGGQPRDYDDLRSSLLPHVLTRRRGLPILLSVVWLEVCRRLDVPADGIGMPGHFVVAVGVSSPGGVPAGGEPVLVDPFAGGQVMSVHEAAERARAASGRFSRDMLAPVPASDVLLRILTNIRVLASRTGQTRTALWGVDMSLLLPRYPADLRRERGELLARVGRYGEAADELEHFASAVEDVEPAAAEAARAGARTTRSRLN
jgi:regulator of sirC expression with transglutaminase-like and TPR domain